MGFLDSLVNSHCIHPLGSQFRPTSTSFDHRRLESPGYFQQPSSGLVLVRGDPHVHPSLHPGATHLGVASQFLALALDVDGLIAAPFGRLQVVQMRRHHGAPGRGQAELLGGAAEDGGRGFEGLEVLRRKNMGPGEGGVLGHVLEQVRVFVGQGAGPEALVELGQAGRGVGPAVRVMPDAGQLDDLIVGPEPRQPVLLEALHQRRPRVFVHADEVGGRVVGGAELLVVGAPELGEMGPGDGRAAEADDGGDGGRRGVERVRRGGAQRFEQGRV